MTDAPSVSVPECPDLLATNRRFYEDLWRGAALVRPERFNTWPIVRSLVATARRRLEIGPGLRPRLPIDGTWFVDISVAALSRLRDGGGLAIMAGAAAIPLPDTNFDLICAFDIVEHLDDDRAGLAELARLATPGGVLLISVPLHASHWTRFDEIVGHRRRYEPAALLDLLAAHGFVVESSAAFGMRPRSTGLTNLGMRLLARHPERALWWYNHLLMPFALMSQRALRPRDGFAGCETTDEVLLICRKRHPSEAAASGAPAAHRP